MFMINLGKGRVARSEIMVQTLIREMLRTRLMMTATLKRLEKIQFRLEGEEFDIQSVEDLLSRIDKKIERDYDRLTKQLDIRG